jgi:hypothetical protein
MEKIIDRTKLDKEVVKFLSTVVPKDFTIKEFKILCKKTSDNIWKEINYIEEEEDSSPFYLEL